MTKTDQLQVSEKADPEPEWDRTGPPPSVWLLWNQTEPDKRPAHGATMMSQDELGPKYAAVVIWPGGGRRYW